MLDETKLSELRAKHGRIKHVVGADNAWEIVLRKPSRVEYKKFRAMSHNPALVADAQEDMVRMIVVHPTREALDALLDDFPAIGEACGSAIQELSGMSAESDLKRSGTASDPNGASRTH